MRGPCGPTAESSLEQEGGAIALASRAQDISRKVGLPRRRRGTEHRCRTRVRRAVLPKRCMNKVEMEGPCGSRCGHVSAPPTSSESASPTEASTTRRSTVGKQCSACSWCNTCDVRRTRLNKGHVSTERAMLSFPFTRPADLRLAARNNPLCQEALEERPWLCEWP